MAKIWWCFHGYYPRISVELVAKIGGVVVLVKTIVLNQALHLGASLSGFLSLYENERLQKILYRLYYIPR